MTAVTLLDRPRIPIAEQILDCFPSGSYALAGLLRLMDIVETDKVPTAAVECRIQPKLLINPEFVQKHAHTSEKLLMLVMHELHHVLLGHTTLFPTITPVQNFVFDAVINGIICRMFPAPEYTSFLTDYYDAKTYPHFLLRPPLNWPNGAASAGGIPGIPLAGIRKIREVHAALYSEAGATYKEVFDLLPKFLSEDAIKGVPLIGGHVEGGATEGDLEHRAPVLFDIVRGIVEEWPQPPDPIQGRSLANVLQDTTIKPHRTTSSRAILRRLIRKVAGVHDNGAVRQTRIDTLSAPTPIPNLNRRAAVLRVLGHEPLLHPNEVSWPRVVRTGERVHVYLDVSGSMEAVKEALYGAVLDCREYVHPQVHLFSTEVASITLAKLSRGVCRSTGGTDIVCVADHMAKNQVRRTLIITDGWVGSPRGRHHTTLAQAKLAVAFLGYGTNEEDLKDVTNFSATLPIGG